MDVAEIAVPAVSAAGGGLTVVWVAKVMLKNWLKKHDELGLAVQAAVTLLTRIDERVIQLLKTEERTREQDKSIAVLETRIDTVVKDLNGLGSRVSRVAAK